MGRRRGARQAPHKSGTQALAGGRRASTGDAPIFHPPSASFGSGMNGRIMMSHTIAISSSLSPAKYENRTPGLMAWLPICGNGVTGGESW